MRSGAAGRTLRLPSVSSTTAATSSSVTAMSRIARQPGLRQLGITDDATALLDRLLSLRNDLGLLAEEYDAVAGRQVGNFPQAFSHLALIEAAARIVVLERLKELT